VVSVTYALFIGDSDFSSAYNSRVPQRQTPASNGAFLTKDEEFLQPEKLFCASQSCSPFMINGNEETLSNASMLHSYSDTTHFQSELKILTLKMLICPLQKRICFLEHTF